MFSSKRFRAVLMGLIAVILMMTTSLLTPATAGAAASQPITHVVQLGENLTVIGRLYGVDPYVLCHHNNISNCNLIYVGQRLVIPRATSYQAGAYGLPPGDPEAAHEKRVRELATVYWSQGVEAWLKAAGYTWNSLTLKARQPEEETFANGDIVVSGYQVEVTNLCFNYPAGMTTDRTVAVGHCHQPSQSNPSKVCTDVQGFSGTATLWVDVQNWGQLWPAAPPALQCPTVPKDLEAWGTVLQWLRDGSGQTAGAQLGDLTAAKITQLEACGCVVQGTNPTVRSVWLW